MRGRAASHSAGIPYCEANDRGRDEDIGLESGEHVPVGHIPKFYLDFLAILELRHSVSTELKFLSVVYTVKLR